MTDQIVTQSSRPEEPQCYNCGGSGHWAVACPEPTRETPAGLAAWRNASATRQGSSRPQHSDGRKSKGPIITKYGPPPPPTPPTTYAAHYPPPPGYHPPHHSYSAPSHQPPHQPPYPPQYHYPPGHEQPPPPPPPSHGQHHYPHPSYHLPTESYHGHHTQPSYSGPSPAYGAAPTAAQNFGAYPYSGHDGQQFVPPRPAYSGSYAQGSASGPKRHHQRQPPPQRNSAPAPAPAPSLPKAQSSHVASSPPKPAASSPPAPITHALPPKPPKSVHDIDHQRDQRNNKRKYDQQNRPRDIKDHHPGRNHGSPKAMPIIHNSHGQSNAVAQHHQGPQNRPSKQSNNRRRSSAGNYGSNHPRMQRQPSKDSLNQHGSGAHKSPQSNYERRRSNSNGERHHEHLHHGNGEPHHGHTHHHQAADRSEQGLSTPKAAETTPTLVKSAPSLPPKPSTVVEAHVPKLSDEHAAPAPPLSPKLSEKNVRGIDGQKDRDCDDRSSTARHGTKSDSSLQEERDDRPLKRFRRASRDRSRSASKHRDGYDLPPLNRRRSRSPQRRSSPSHSPRSRNSSVSSRSSDLNSLEAELLGVSDRRPSTDSEPRRRPERIAPPKAKRRKPTNSAFSRRW